MTKQPVPAYLSTETIDAMTAACSEVPGLTYSAIAEAAVADWLAEVEAEKAVIRTIDSQTVKEAGQRFPPRQGPHKRGRPLTDDSLGDRAETRSVKYYLPRDLADRYDAATWWLGRPPSYSLDDAIYRWLTAKGFLNSDD